MLHIIDYFKAKVSELKTPEFLEEFGVFSTKTLNEAEKVKLSVLKKLFNGALYVNIYYGPEEEDPLWKIST